MKITAEIVAVGQKVNFDTGGVVHTMDLRLTGGEMMTVDISEKHAEWLIGVFAGGMEPQEHREHPLAQASYGAAPSVAEAPRTTMFDTADGDQVVVFGSAPEAPRRAPHVSMDEMGNPLVRHVSPPPEDPDEEGVPAA